MDLVVTDKGRQYLERLKSSPETEIGNWDSAFLAYIDMEPSTEDLERRIGTKGKEVVRRLFESGYITYEGEDYPEDGERK